MGRPFRFTFEIPVIAANSSADIPVEEFKYGNYTVKERSAQVVLNAAFGGALAGTPLPEESSPTAANNTMPSRALVLVETKAHNEDEQNKAYPIDIFAGPPRHPTILRDVEQHARDKNYRIKVTNRTTEAIRGYIVLSGEFND